VPVAVAAERHHGPVPLVRARRLGTRDQLGERPELQGADLHDVVALLAQRPGDRPAAVRGDVQERHAHAEVLDIRDDLRQLLRGADDHGVADRLVTGEGGEVTVHLALDSVVPGPGLDEPELESGHVSQGIVLGTAAAVGDTVVPVAAQHRKTRTLSGQCREKLQQPWKVPRYGFPASSTVHRHGTVRQDIASVDEQRAAIHAPPSFPIEQEHTSLPGLNHEADRTPLTQG
jgi:hypothetical protein